MNQKDIITFLKVAETGSVTQSADALGRSQPSVTRCLQDLEATLGFALFTRVGRRISLTAEGVAFEEESRRLLQLMRELPERTRARASAMQFPLTISSTYALGTGLVPHAIARWSSAQQPREIRMIQSTPNGVAQDLLSGNARIGLASLPLDVPGVICHRRYSAPLVIALPAAQAEQFPKGVPVALQDVMNDTLITMLDQARLQGRIQSALDATGVTPPRVMRANSSAAALQLARLLAVPAIVEPVTAFGATPPDIILRPIADQIDFTFGLFSTEGGTVSTETTTFFDACEAALFDLIPQVKRIDRPENLRT
ncbi:DNA-binding transcriptional LysR family regulator [Pacificibacter maritimus]|uniref:DNA-binding transcriptional LysR family regulator n=1 Tax=Pacificibacter maritimus TaxID=762213 RepID=A0A3N4UTR3_9RHOB|nr:LysR family transcriptional regulator [Pacificibacter maritimus]RPE70941.1 DNA-binding transcriptional LysR family regulator [Pacificibacter maritimus]